MRFPYAVIVGLWILLSPIALQLVRADDGGALLPLSTVEGRLTLTTGTPVTTSDVTAAGTLYFTPYKGNRVYLYDGTRWKLYSFNELSADLSNIIPGGIVAGKNYDIYLQDSGAGLVLSASSAWTNDTTRADPLALQDGVYVAGSDHTMRYLGTIRATLADVTADSATQRFVWNYYNRVPRKLYNPFEDVHHAFAIGDTWRAWNDGIDGRVEMVIGIAEVPVDLSVAALVGASSAPMYGAVGIDADGTSTNDADTVETAYIDETSDFQKSDARLMEYPAVGYHFYQPMEYISGSRTMTFYGTYFNQTVRRNGMLGHVDG